MKRMMMTAIVMLAMTSAVMAQETNKETSNRIQEQQMKAQMDSLDAVFDSLELKGVTVTAQKPLVKMEADKMSYDVGGDTDSRSSTVLEMLRKVPMVSVDGQDNITVNGSSSFKVYVDGKPNVMFSQNASQIFKMMPAASVSKIEVITNPGAKYDAEGAVGVLNIVLAKQQGGGSAAQALNGLTGTVRGTVGTKGAGGGVFFSAQQGKLSASGNAMYQYQKMSGLEVTMNRETLSDGSLMHYEQNGTQRVPFTMGNVSLGYDVDSLNTVSATVGVTAFSAKMSSSPSTWMTGPAYGEGLSYTYDMTTRMRSTSLNASADWQHFFSADRDRYLTFSYLMTYAPQRTEVKQIYPAPMPSMETLNKPKSLEQTFQLDYTTPIAQGQTLNLGGKYIMRDNDSWTEDLEYKHGNDIGAAYVEYDGKFGIFGAKAGLRYEHTWQNVEYKKGNGADFKKNYGNLVPSLALSLSPSMTQNIGMTYNMRISRPGITYLNPYVDRSMPGNITYGNSYIDVEKMHNLGLTYSSFSQTLMVNVGLHQSFSNNQISDYSFYEDGLLHNTYGNVVKQRNSSLSAFVNWMAAPKTRLMLNGELNYVDMRSEVLDMKNSGWQGNIMVGAQQTLPWDVKLSLNAIANTKSYTLQGWSTGMEALVASVTKSLLNDRLSITLAGITGLQDGGSINMDSHSRGRDFTNLQHIKVPLAQAQLHVSYTFGNTRVRAKEHKSRIENDFMEKKSEQEQINSTTNM